MAESSPRCEVTPARLARAYPLPDLWRMLTHAPARTHALILAAITIHLDRLWRPFD